MTNIIEIICENLGGTVEVPMGTPLSEVAKRVAPGPYPFLAALVNNRIKELYYKIYTPVTVRFVDITSFAGIRVYQRTSWFILQKAARDLFPGKTLHIRHSMGQNGFYCEIEGIDEFTPGLAEALEGRMRDLVAQDLPISRMKILTSEVRARYAAQTLELTGWVENEDDGSVTLSLNDHSVPELHVSREFSDMLDEYARNRANQSKESREAMLFLKQKMDSARNFINAVKQRQQTMLSTMKAIIDLQMPFFREGDESLLRPMILKDVAALAGLDISTVSRVSNSKYVQTNYGIYPLKFFFSDGYTTGEGEELSTREIRRVLKECVEKEDKAHPLTDDELARILKEKGFAIARRTVAKYREQLGIPVARLRK